MTENKTAAPVATFDRLAKAIRRHGIDLDRCSQVGESGQHSVRYWPVSQMIDLERPHPDGGIEIVRLQQWDGTLTPFHIVERGNRRRETQVPAHTKEMAVGSFLTEMREGLGYLLNPSVRYNIPRQSKR